MEYEANGKNFVESLFQTIDEFHGDLGISEYKIIVLNLIFLRYLSHEFDKRYQELIDENKGFEEDIDEYLAKNVFFIPKDARWDFISKNAHSVKNGVIIDQAIRSIESKNTLLRGVLSKVFSREELDKIQLGILIDLITNVKLDSSSNIWTRIFEICLYKFSELENNDSSDSYTPISIIQTIVRILNPTGGRVYDPCCGTGGMLIQTIKFLESQEKSINDVSIYGQEINHDRWKLSRLNTLIHKIDADIGNHADDSFSNDLHKRLKADYILANPKFNMSNWGLDGLKEDIRWKYGIPRKGNANFAWMQHMIHHLSPTGKIGLVLANGSLSSTTSTDDKIRQAIVEDDLVECIIALPTQLFYSGGIPVCLWFLNKNKKQKEKTLFIDARDMGEMVSRRLRVLTPMNIGLLSETFSKFEQGVLEDEKGFCKVSDIDEIKKHDFILTPGRYVGFKPEEDDGIPFEEKMQSLTNELYELMDESDKLGNNIKNNLKQLGFERLK